MTLLLVCGCVFTGICIGLFVGTIINQPRYAHAIAALRAIEGLIHDSDGVVGLHLNGDIAYWEDLRTGGQFEEWLYDVDNASEYYNI